MVPLDVFAGRRKPGDNGGAAYRRPPFFRTKRLALLGATDNLEFAPWDDPRWTLAAHPCCRPRCQREPDWYFDLHRPECFRVERKGWNAQYYAWLKQLQTPIFMQENWPEIPMSVRYPKERVFAECRPYFTNHCAYLIALAMTEGVTHIGLYGCQYAGAERGTQRDSLTYWLGRFEQAGGTVVIPPYHNTLLTQVLYGYDSHDAQGQLIPAYRVPRVTTKGGKAVTLVDPSTVPLMRHPFGEEPAYDRAALLFGPALGPDGHHARVDGGPVSDASLATHTHAPRVADCPTGLM